MLFSWGLFIGTLCGAGITLCVVGSIYWRDDNDEQLHKLVNRINDAYDN